MAIVNLQVPAPSMVFHLALPLDHCSVTVTLISADGTEAPHSTQPLALMLTRGIMTRTAPSFLLFLNFYQNIFLVPVEF